MSQAKMMKIKGVGVIYFGGQLMGTPCCFDARTGTIVCVSAFSATQLQTFIFADAVPQLAAGLLLYKYRYK